jgi:hypothetical protein
MAGQVGTKSEMQIAQEAVKNYTSKLGSNINLSLVVYGHRGSNQEKDKVISCKGVEEVFALGQGESVAISNAVDKLAPTGYTPIAGALEKTGKILADYPALRYKNVALIISDGQETCGGDPAEQAERLYESEIELVTNVIGFDVGGAAEAELTDIAFSGGGEYYDVSYEAEMITALNQFADWQEMFACQTEENLRTLNEYLDINNRNFECTHRLNMEKFALEMEFNLLNINYDNHGEEVQRACGEYIVDNYQQRFNRIKSAIIEAYESQKQAILTNQAKFDQLIDSQFADQDADDREGYGDIEGDEFYTRQELEEEFDEFEFELR